MSFKIQIHNVIIRPLDIQNKSATSMPYSAMFLNNRIGYVNLFDHGANNPNYDSICDREILKPHGHMLYKCNQIQIRMFYMLVGFKQYECNSISDLDVM